MSCPQPSRANRLRRLAELQAEAARIVATLAEEEAADEDPGVAPPSLPKPAHRRGPRIPRGIVVSPEMIERVRKSGGIVGE